MNDAKLVVFLATHNRLDTLERTLRSFKRLTTPHEVVIIDNGTDHPKCVELLNKLSRDYRIYDLPPVFSMEQLTDHYNVAIRDVYKQRGCPKWFAVTDADVCFDGTHRNALDAYIHLALELRQGVGPHLRVDAGIPAGYPLRTMVITTQTWLTYRRNQRWLHGIPWMPSRIDTTFHVFPRARQHKRLRMNTVRVGAPFDAMHLDWYMDIFAPTEENAIYLHGQGSIGSWGKGWLVEFWDAYQQDPERALVLSLQPPSHELHPYPFVASWMYHIGLPGELTFERRQKSIRLFWEAIPDSQPSAAYRRDSVQMLFNSDFSMVNLR